MAILANLGVPMLFFQWPLMLGALPAVIFIEAYLCRHWYALPWPRAVKVVTLANLLSTVLGFPLMWIALMMAQPHVEELIAPGQSPLWSAIRNVTVKAPWLDPGPNQGYWMIPTACLVLLVPAFFMTVFVESLVYRRAFREDSSQLTPMQATWRMHFFSYGFLFVAGILLLTASIVKHQRTKNSRPVIPERREFRMGAGE